MAHSSVCFVMASASNDTLADVNVHKEKSKCVRLGNSRRNGSKSRNPASPMYVLAKEIDCKDLAREMDLANVLRNGIEHGKPESSSVVRNFILGRVSRRALIR